jgi:DNA polymerase I-like protein with 3'-5' exonuclease and polymerase domains
MKYLIGEWDGSQLEFRVAGHLSRDPQILDDIIKGHDVHRFTGVWMYHAPEHWLKNVGVYMKESMGLMHLVTDDQRQDSKPETFKPVYGGTSGTKRQQAYYKAFNARYHVLARTQNEWVMEVLQHKRLVTEWGMTYYWPQARMSADGYVNVKSQVYNYPVQALATAEIIPIALAFFRQRIARYGAAITILNTVHDSVVCRVREDHVEAFREAAVAVWADVYEYLAQVYRITDWYVPLGTEVGVSSHWGDKKGRVFAEKYTIWPDGRIVTGA